MSSSPAPQSISASPVTAKLLIVTSPAPISKSKSLAVRLSTVTSPAPVEMLTTSKLLSAGIVTFSLKSLLLGIDVSVSFITIFPSFWSTLMYSLFVE